MGKKMKFPFLFKSTDSAAAATSSSSVPSPWPWPSCGGNPKTLSFRATANTTNIYKTMNTAYLDDKTTSDFAETPDSFFSIRNNSLDHRLRGGNDCFSDETAVIGGLKSDRLFFDPGETSSILEEASKAHAFPYGDTTKLAAMDSDDPFLDFRASMAEMVEAHRLDTWKSLEELLTCYLTVNEKSNHGYIVGAFVDLLVHISLQSSASSSIDSSISSIDEEHCSSSSTTTQYSFTSPLSFSSSSTYSSTSPYLSLVENDDDIAAAKCAAGAKEGVR